MVPEKFSVLDFFCGVGMVGLVELLALRSQPLEFSFHSMDLLDDASEPPRTARH